MTTGLKAIAIFDQPEEDEDVGLHFYIIEGICKKCLLGPNTLVMYDFKANSKKNQSLFKTQCISCGHRDVHYAKNIERN